MGSQDTINEIINWHNELRRTQSDAEVVRSIEEKIKSEVDALKLRFLNIALAKEYEAQGNLPKAEEIFRRDPIEEVDRWHYDLAVAKRDDIVAAIQARIQSEADPIKLRRLRLILAREYTRVSNYAAAETIFRDEFERDQDDPTPLISLAEQKLYYEEQPASAMPIIDEAIQTAYRSGIYRRLALGVKARVALHLQRYDLVEGVLKEILQLKFTRGNFDIGRERDFLDRLPAGAISEDVARQYDAFCPAAGKTSPGGSSTHGES